MKYYYKGKKKTGMNWCPFGESRVIGSYGCHHCEFFISSYSPYKESNIPWIECSKMNEVDQLLKKIDEIEDKIQELDPNGFINNEINK